MQNLPAAPNRSGPLRVSLVAGCVVDRDAISNIVRQHADALTRDRTSTTPAVDLRIFTGGTNVRDSRIVVLNNAPRLATDPHFLSSDLIVFHFGIRYPMFDAVLLAPRTARVVVYYYGITPPGLFGPADRDNLTESYRQLNNLFAADQVLTSTNHIREELLRVGVPNDRVAICAPGVSFNAAARPVHDGPLRLLYVGRFVPSKGIPELLSAFEQFAARYEGVTLDLVGSTTWVDPAYLQQLQDSAKSPRLAGKVRFHFDLPVKSLALRYAHADVLVLPSRHEGFGVPVVEAMTAGCYVVGTDAAALPETIGGLGRIYPVGDAEALARRLCQVAWAWDRGLRPVGHDLVAADEWHRRAAEYSAQFSIPAAANRLREQLFNLLPTHNLPAGVRDYLAERQRGLCNELRSTYSEVPGPSALHAYVRGIVPPDRAAA